MKLKDVLDMPASLRIVLSETEKEAMLKDVLVTSLRTTVHSFSRSAPKVVGRIKN